MPEPIDLDYMLMFAHKVERMMKHQQDYFKTSDKNALEKSKVLEREVREQLSIIFPPPPPAQTSLF